MSNGRGRLPWPLLVLGTAPANPGRGASAAVETWLGLHMRVPSRRSLAEARIALGSFDRFLLLYGALFAAFGVASPFLPALLHERGLGPSEIGAVLAAGTAVRLITGPAISRLADRLGKHQQTLAVLTRWLLSSRSVILFPPGLRSSSLLVSRTLRRWRRSCRLPTR
jgi:nitrate/nitrite transporter NarK